MTLADAFNVGSEFDLTGPDGKVLRTFRFRKPTLTEQGEFQRWLERRAHDAVDRSEDSDDRKDRRHHAIDVDAGLGMYEWDGPLALKSMWTPACLTKIAEIIARDQSATPDEIEQVVAQHIKRVAVAILSRAVADPKVMAPILGALGLPTDWLRSEPNEPSSSSSSTPPSTEPSPNSAGSATTSSCSSMPSSADTTGS